MLNKRDFENLKFKRDLQYFEGTLLAEYIDVKTSKTYLLYWVDLVKESNRWLVFNEKEDNLKSYLGKKISLKQLIENNNEEKEYYLADIKENNKVISFETINLKNIDKDYIPEENSYLLEDFYPIKNNHL